MWLGSSSNSSIFGNNITNGYYGIYLDSSSNSSISNNNIANNYYGIVLYFSSNYNSISGNNITNNNGYGILLSYSSNNMVYHNNFINNVVQASIWGESANVWDDGYPSGGNYWNDYTSADFYSGPYQNQTGSDGIGDTSYVIDTSNQDNYPLMKPYGGSYDIGITNITTSKTVVGQGYSLNITIKILNYGINAQTFNVTVYANTTTIQTITSITLTSRNSTTLTFTWNTTGFAYGNYTLSAYAWPVPGETNVLDNNFTCGTVLVSVPGDVNADGKVDGKDLGWVAWCFGSYPGAPPPMTWDPNCDINNDGKIDGKDLGIVAEHFGEPHP
jgi:parallel beta-helix repeat protein